MKVIPIAQPAPAPGSPLDYALKYAAIGWHVFPVWGAVDGKCRCKGFCKSPAKHPVGHLAPLGQDNATTDPATIRRWWAQMPDAGVAVHLKPSGLCAIDIDPRNGGLLTMEQIEAEHGPLVSDVLQYTQGGGEHRVFKLAADIDISLVGKLGPGVDVKRNGYIVLQPTAGTAGVYGWEASSNPVEGAIPTPLPDWIRDLATIAPPAFEETAASRFVTEAQIGELRDALAVLSSDDRDTWVRFGLALCPIGQAGFDLWDKWSQRSAKYDPVDAIRVWRSFRPGAINFESIFFAAQQAGWVNPLAGGAPAPVKIESVRILPAAPDPEPVAFKLPGVMGQVEEWINATSRKPQPLFATQAALAFASTVLGRRYVTTQRNWPSLYFLNVGKSASGKEHAKWAIEHLLEACNLPRLIGPSFYTSESGLLSALHEQPSHITIVDEFGKVLEAASLKHSARAHSTLKALMETWARCDGTVRPQGYSTFGMTAKDAEKFSERSIRNPALSMLAMTTPDSFFEAIGSAAARDGFLNRMLIVESDVGRQVGRHLPDTPIPQTVLDWAADVHQSNGPVNPDISAAMAANPKVIAFAKPSLASFAEFEHECIRLMDEYDQAGLAEMFGRSNEIAMRVSLLLAVGCGSHTISPDHADLAIQYVRHHAITTTRRLQSVVADSEFESVKKQVLALIVKAGSKGMTERELNKASRKFAAIDQRGQLNVLNSLQFAGDVSRVSLPTMSGRGSPRVAWIPIDGDNPPT